MLQLWDPGHLGSRPSLRYTLSVGRVMGRLQVSTKKDAQQESWELSFIWGQNEDCSPGRGSAGEYQADERAGVARLSWRVSGR